MRRTADEIDYELIGDDLQAVIVTLDPGETVIAEAGAMMFMEDGIEMNTTLDPNKQGGGVLGKLFAGAKRVLSGDTFFITTFMNAGRVRRRVAFSSHFPGKIKPVDLREWGGTIVAQKDSFLCAPKGTNVDIAFTRRIGAGFFGGEGFILQRITGDGVAVLHASGALWETTLTAGETLRVDTGCIVAMEAQVQYDIQMVPGVKTALFGGEGLFFATLSGPGRVMLQTMPFSRLADRILAAAPRAGGRQMQESGGTALGVVGGAVLGGLLGRD
ncbi:TIGR00266 family protein [soil metagenome]